jgi:hypothetical protein
LSFSLPYSFKRRYLTGIDWIVGALDRSAHKAIGLGGFSQAIIELDGIVDERALRTALDQVSGRIPLIHGRVARDWLNLAPYWKVPPNAAVLQVPLRVVELPEERAGDAERLFDEHVNLPFQSRWEHLRCLLVYVGRRRSRLGMLFDHRLLDAFGAEAIFRLIDLAWQGRLDEIVPLIRQTEPAHLDHWRRRLASGRTLNRYLHRLNERSVCGLKMPSPGLKRRIRFQHDSMTPEQSADFARKAAEEIGMPIILPSAAARAIAAMRQVVPAPPLLGDQCLVFTSATNRLPGQEWERLLFNHFALMGLSARQDVRQSTSEIAADLRDQFFEHMRLQIPFVMQDAGALGRICPIWLASRMMNALFGGRFCSFYFACLRETGFPGDTFLGLPAVALIHKPLAFAPPGMNICMTWFANHFNLVISYVEGVISDAAAANLLHVFKSSLLY